MVDVGAIAKLIFNTYFHNRKAMESICIKHRWLFLMILNILVPIVFYSFNWRGYLQYLQQIEIIENADLSVKYLVVLIAAGGIYNIFICLIRSILIFITLIAESPYITFKQIMAINGLSYLAVVPMIIIMAIEGRITGKLLMNFSPAVLFADLRGSYLYGWLRGFCLFIIWQYMMIGNGVLQLTGKRKSLLCVAAVFVLYIMINIPYFMKM